MLETFTQRVGYRPGEQVASHARHRFRLVPTSATVSNAPQVDPSLWLVHYGPSPQPIPAELLPVPPPMSTALQQRMQLQRGGMIARKDFMLADRLNWPTINLPREGRGHPMMAQPPAARNIPQQMAYPPHPNKRSRTAAHAAAQQQQQHHMVPAAHFVAFDEEEDTHNGDMFDHLTPRDISMARYMRNHEWMEEVLGTAYRIGQIVPADLGLGLQGELSSVTEGIFEASGVDAHKKPPSKPVVGRLDAELAGQFKKRVADKILADQAELARMKAAHEKKMAKFNSNSILMRAERELRVAVADTGHEFWRLEGKDEDNEDGTTQFHDKSHRRLEEIVADIESALGRHIEVISDVKRVQDGGYQEPPPEPEVLPMPPSLPVPAESSVAGPSQLPQQPRQAGFQNGGGTVGESDIIMGGTTAGPIDQTQPGAPSHPMPHNQMPNIPPAVTASGTGGAPPPQPAVGQAVTQAPISEDFTMQDSGVGSEPSAAPDQGTESGDWVVVPKGGVSPRASASGPPAAEIVAAPSEPAAAASSLGEAAKPSDHDLGEMNTAGEALSSYGQANDDLTGDIGDGMDLGMEDSAFGDAVYGVEESRGSADTPADGI